MGWSGSAPLANTLRRYYGPVQVTFNDGTSGCYDLVARADGMRSR